MECSYYFISFLVVCLTCANAQKDVHMFLPYNAKPGYVLGTLSYWGQTFRLKQTSQFSHNIAIQPNGAVYTKGDIASFKDESFEVLVDNYLADELWKTTRVFITVSSEDFIYFTKRKYTGHIEENKPSGTDVLGFLPSIELLHGYDQPVLYSLSRDSRGQPVDAFTLAVDKCHQSDTIHIKSLKPLDHERRSRYTLVLSAWTKSRDPIHTTAKVVINVDDVNDNVPEFTVSEYVVDLEDYDAHSHQVGQVHAVDKDGDPVTYNMATHPLFWLNSQNGKLFVKNRNMLGSNRVEVFKVTAEDCQGHRGAPAVVSVLVPSPRVRRRARRRSAQLDPMYVELNENRRGSLFSLPTDGTKRFKFKAPRPKEFLLNEVTGEVRLRHGHEYKLDYEQTPEIRFVVIVTSRRDHKYRREQPVVIRLDDVNDELPRFVNVPRPFLATVQENSPPGASVYQLMATDADRDSNIHYLLESGGEKRFEVDRTTGVVRTLGRAPFRKGMEYEIGVSAQDTAAPVLQKSATESLKILVGQRPPQFFKTQYVATVSENAKTQTSIVDIKAYSHQGFPIVYNLTTETGQKTKNFAINRQSGVVDLLRELDYETEPHQYHLRVEGVEDGRPPRSATVNLIINLKDENDNSPVFPLSQYIVQGIAETVGRGIDIIQVTATDHDSVTNSQLTYSVSDGNFSVETRNNIGYIQTARRLDYDRLPDHTYNFTVVATDNGKPARSSAAMVRVSVTNVNDEDPVFTKRVDHVQVSEDASPDTVVHVVQAYDPDGDDITYAFTGGRLTNGPFSIEPNSGILKLTTQLDKSQVAYKLNITATDNGKCCGGTTSRSSRGLVIIEVKDINNNAPRFGSCSSYMPEVAENENTGTSVIKVRAHDKDTGANGNVTYSLVKTANQDSVRFTIDPDTGIVRTAEVFDREKNINSQSYGITVKAEDQGTPSLAGFCTFRVKVGDKNDNPPVFDFPEYSTSIEEASQVGKRIIQVYATDKDAGENGRVTYRMEEQQEPHRPLSRFFAISRSSGWISVARAMSGRKKVRLRVIAMDNGYPTKESFKHVVIHITKTVNEYPQWADDYSSKIIAVAENVPVNHIVARLKATSNIAGGYVNYLIQKGDTPQQNSRRAFYHTIDENTNEMVIMTYQSLDYETTPFYVLTVNAANRGANTLRNSTRIRIQVEDKNDEIPTFMGLDENGRYPGSVAENSPRGSEVIAVSASDADEQPRYREISYRIKQLRGSDHNMFTIDRHTGMITTNQEFDRERRGEYYITVVAEDGAASDRPNHYPPNSPNTGEAEVRVRITDKNDNAPRFSKRRYEAEVPENVEPGAVVISVTATDKDEENTLTYSIISGNTGNVFEVSPETGEIKVRGKLDFEGRPGFPAKTVYYLNYRVFDNMFYNETTIVVRVTDVNDNPPKFEHAIYNVTDITEEIEPRKGKSIPILTVRAKDPDVRRYARYPEMRYSLTGQFADAGVFRIDERSGTVFLTRPLDRDKPYGRSVWNFNVLAHDEPGSGESLTGYAEVRVLPGDINDNAPRFERNRLTGRVMEHSRAGASVMTVIATDSDLGRNGSIIYSIKENAVKNGQGIFTIDSNTGLITTTQNNALDRETVSVYQITVQARDRGSRPNSASATVTITVEDINDHAPVFKKKLYEATMSESYPVGTSVTSVLAVDSDRGSNAKLQYSLLEKDRVNFGMTTVDATNTGVLKVFKPVDFDNGNSFFNLTVQVRDPDTSHVDTAYIQVYVTDFNDNAPEFVSNSKKVQVPENVTRGTSLATFTATDSDTGINRIFSYSIDRKTDPFRQFAVDGNGLVTIANKLDRETTPTHRVHILAIDKGSPPQTGTGTLIVTLLDINDNYPSFARDYQPVVYENEAAGQHVATISAIDRDQLSNGPPFYFRLPCNGGCPCNANPTCDAFQFSFTPGAGDNGYGSGEIRSTMTFDREKRKFYLMPIIMQDSGKPVQSGTNTLTITIGDVNDNQHYPGYKRVHVYNYKGQYRKIPLGPVYAEDKDDWDVVDKEFVFVDSATEDIFNLDTDSGQLSFKDRAREGAYNFRVRVYDRAWSRGVVSSVSVIVENLKDDAITNSGSLRVTGITAEDFISRPKTGPATTDYGKSKYDEFRALVAGRLGAREENVQVFSVRNTPLKQRTVDIRFSVHGSPYYRPTRLNGVLTQDKDYFEKALGVKIVMAPIDECLSEVCESEGCSNNLVIQDTPQLVSTNGTSMVGVSAYVVAECVCSARNFTDDDTVCSPTSCLNGGTCQQKVNQFECLCPRGFDGPRCQQTHHSFDGRGWAWFDPLTQCEDSHTSLEFATNVEDGIIFYNGPITTSLADGVKDFILLELRRGFPVLRIDHGTGEAKLTVDGRDQHGVSRMNKLNDGAWHRLDILRSGKVTRSTPGDSRFINVNTPLQLGGRSDAEAPYPADAMIQGFNGCIKNLWHNGQMYDLHVGRVGHHLHSQDGCAAEERACGRAGEYCGDHGLCVGSLRDKQYKCHCRPGWNGPICDKQSQVVDFGSRSFVEWDFRDVFYDKFILGTRHRLELQLQFRTRQDYGRLFQAQNIQKSEYIIVEISKQHIQFRYNLGSGQEILNLAYVNVSDGQWHTVRVSRVGKAVTLTLDSGEGRFQNMSMGRSQDHFSITLNQRQLFAGGDVKFPATNSDPIVDNDFRDSCMSDVRIFDEPLPLTKKLNKWSRAAEVTGSRAVQPGCPEGAICHSQLICPAPLQCVNLWRLGECRCPAGLRHVASHEICDDFNECEETVDICNEGICRNTHGSYHCTCRNGWEGQNCDRRLNAIVAALTPGAIMAIVCCTIFVLILVLGIILYNKRRRPDAYIVGVDPDDDVRENIIHYDEEGVGEEDQDTYDINRLRKPVESTHLLRKGPPVSPRPPELPSRPVMAGEQMDVKKFITARMNDANEDSKSQQRDSVHVYAYEGEGSTAGSLSSLGTADDSGDEEFQYLQQWGPRFSKLADLYQSDPVDTSVDC